MKTVNIYKAQGIGDNIAENINIVIDTQIPNFDNKGKSLDCLLKKADIVFTEQAETLGKMMVDSLPGGTVDRLLVFLLDHKRCRFVVKG